MTASSQTGATPSSALIKVLFLIALAIGFTAWCVSHSAAVGRLSTSPLYDDCVYFWNGAGLLQAVRDKGLDGVQEYLAAYGLHSPYSVPLAALAFGLLGPAESSPYIANGLIFLFYISLVAACLRSLPLSSWFAAIIVFSTLPFASMVVAEFRPDLCWAVITGFGVIYVVTRDGVLRSRWPTVLAAACLSFSLLVKPSTFAMTIILYGLAAISRFADWKFSSNGRFPTKEEINDALSAAALTLFVLAGPYFLYFGHDIWSYFWVNSFGANREVWLFRGDAWHQFTYYIWGMGGQSNIGYSGILLIAVYVAGCIWLWRRKSELRVQLVAINSIIFCAYLINALAQMKSAYLGGAFFGTWIFASAFVIDRAFFECPADRRRLLMRSLWVLALLCLLSYRWPRMSNVAVDGLRPKSFRFAELRFNELLEKNRATPPANVLFLQGGPVVMENVGVWAIRNHTGTKVGSGAFLRSVEEFRKAISTFDWIVLQDKDILGNCEILPSESHLPDFISAISSDPKFHLLEEIPGIDGKKMYVFAKVKP